MHQNKKNNSQSKVQKALNDNSEIFMFPIYMYNSTELGELSKNTYCLIFFEGLLAKSANVFPMSVFCILLIGILFRKKLNDMCSYSTRRVLSNYTYI